MVRNDLPEYLVDSGFDFLKITDELNMHAQGAMWVYNGDISEWRYYLITVLMEHIGKKKLYSHLLRAFKYIDMPDGMIIDDIFIGSTSNPIFRMLSNSIGVSGNSKVRISSKINGISFEGIVYRSIMDDLNSIQAGDIERMFLSRIRQLERGSILKNTYQENR